MDYLFALLEIFIRIILLHGYVVGVTGNNDPTFGFTSIHLSQSHFKIQKPYNLPVSSRYSYNHGVHRLWVLSNDKPFSPSSPTKSRTEIRIKGHDYSSGVCQFEGQAYVPSGTTGTCIMQIHGDFRAPTVMMLLVYDGALMYYKRQVLADDIYGKWLQVNVIHNVDQGVIKVFIDGDLKFSVSEHRNSTYYFKVGVYTQDYTSYFTESLWKGIKVLKIQYPR